MSKIKSHQVYKTSDGKQVPGVTTIIGILDKPAIHYWIAKITKQGYDWDKFRDDKSEVGSLSHAMILAHFKAKQVDTLDYTKNQISLAENSFLKFLEWAKDKNFEPWHLEQPFVNETYRYGGTPDYVGLINGVSTILDFKTGGIYEEHYIQLSAYERLIDVPIKALRLLSIGRDETESFEDKLIGNHEKYWQIFLNCLNIYNLRKQKGGIMTEKLAEILLKDGDVIKFTPTTKEYGRAEFICCPVFRRGKLKEFYLYPAQQPNAKHYYKLDLKYQPLDFTLTSYSHNDIESPKIWLHFWCQDHKCHSFRLYVPPTAHQFRVSMLSNLGIYFEE